MQPELQHTDVWHFAFLLRIDRTGAMITLLIIHMYIYIIYWHAYSDIDNRDVEEEIEMVVYP
jgi:hypothetical protein